MTDPAATTQVLGKAGEPCAGCGAPLAADQRYCLNCGRRRGGPRIDFQSHLAPPGAIANGSRPPAEAPAPEMSNAGRQRDYTPLAAVGGIAVLGVMLLIGVLIGKGNGDGTTAAPAPVVVQGSEGAQTKATAGEGGEAKPQAKQAKSKSSGKGGGKNTAAKGGGSNTGSAPVASDAELQHLQEQSPQEYSENSAKLPDEIATGGAPPPEDNKAPGGGSTATAIE
jgi:hypothetical protein